MKALNLLFFFVFTASFAVDEPFCNIQEPANLGNLKKEVNDYYESGEYEKDVKCVVDQARSYLKSKLPAKPEDSLVFDIDDTVLSTWKYNKGNDFGYDKFWSQHWENEGNFPPIEPVKDLYDFAQKENFKVFFITGRKGNLKDATEKNLKNAGFKQWDGIFFKPDSYSHTSRAPFKAAVRKLLTEQGYDIILNMGDQESDLQGGYSQETFKLPNPMYYIP